jgi:hypothetical protein
MTTPTVPQQPCSYHDYRYSAVNASLRSCAELQREPDFGVNLTPNVMASSGDYVSPGWAMSPLAGLCSLEDKDWTP